MLSVTVLSPETVSSWIETWIGWNPVAPPPPPSSDPQARAVAETVSRERLYEHLRYLSTGPSRVTGYRGAFRAAEYIEQHDAFEAIAREWFAREAHSSRIIRASIRGDQTESLIAANPANPTTPKSSSNPVDGSGAATAM